MAYGGGTYPTEAASKVAHMRLLENPSITAMLTQFDSIEGDALPSSATLSGHVDLEQPCGLSHVVTVDGGEVVVPNPIRREKAVGFINVCTTLLRWSDLNRLREDPWIDPRDYAQMLTESQTPMPAVLPLAGVTIPNQTVRQSIRTLIDQNLEVHRLYPALNFLVSRMWNPGYEMPGPGSPHMECRRCRASFRLPRNTRLFQCPECEHSHTLSDYLGIGEDSAEDLGRAESVSQLRDVMETLSLFSVIMGLYTEPVLLRGVLLIKDGPLLLRANLSRLAEAIREFLAFLKSMGVPLHLVGVEKNGEFADHVPFIRPLLPEPGDYFLPSARYIVEEIKGGEFPSDPQLYRNRVNYGAKLIVRLGRDHVVALNVPTGEFLVNPQPQDLLGLEVIVRGLSQLVSYRYENALMPVVLTNSAASLSFNPSGRILERFVEELLRERRR